MIDTSSSKSQSAPKELPRDFVPSPYSVIIGRAKECKQSSGNRRLRIMATAYLTQYASAINRSVKSQVVSHSVAMVRQACGPEGGAFIKKMGKAQDGSTIWVEVSDSAAREKIGYVFRDLLCDHYRSSSKSKSMNRLRRQRAEMKKVPEQPPVVAQQQEQPQLPFIVEPTPLEQLSKNINNMATPKSQFDFLNIPSSLIAMAKQQSELMNASQAVVKPDLQKSVQEQPSAASFAAASAFLNNPAVRRASGLFSSPAARRANGFFTPAVRRGSDVAWIQVMAENLQEC
jgi:hypothetical protein